MKLRMGNREIARREGLVDLAQVTADGLKKPPYRAVVIVTDESGDFVGVGMNTTLDDAINIMKCALHAEGLLFHGEDTENCSRRGPKRRGTPRATPKKGGKSQ